MESLSSFAFKKISNELKDMTLNPPEGVLIIINEENLTDIQAWIQGPST